MCVQAEASSMTNGTVGVPSQAEPPSGPAGPKRRRQECLEGPSLAEQGSSSMANQVISHLAERVVVCIWWQLYLS